MFELATGVMRWAVAGGTGLDCDRIEKNMMSLKERSRRLWTHMRLLHTSSQTVAECSWPRENRLCLVRCPRSWAARWPKPPDLRQQLVVEVWQTACRSESRWKRPRPCSPSSTANGWQPRLHFNPDRIAMAGGLPQIESTRTSGVVRDLEN